MTRLRTRMLWALLALLLPAWAGATVYEVGPGKPLTALAAVPWGTLAPGDVVRVYPGVYRERIQVTRGCTIQGVPGPGGERPVIDGENSVLLPGYYPYAPMKGIGLIVVMKGQDGSTPTGVTIEGLHFVHNGPAYPVLEGGVSVVPSAAAGAVMIYAGTHVLIRDCEVSDCENGIFAKSSGTSVTTDLWIDRCHIHDCGTVGGSTHHQVYTEARGMRLTNSRLGPGRKGSPSCLFADRSVQTVVENCVLELHEGGGRHLNLVDPDDSADNPGPNFTADPNWGKDIVRNCLLIERYKSASSFLQYGHTEMGVNSRRGPLLMDHCTMVSTCPRTAMYYLLGTKMPLDVNAIVLRDCILAELSLDGTPAPIPYLSSQYGKLTIEGHLWASPGWKPYLEYPAGSHTIVIAGLENVLAATTNDPGFTNPAAGDFTLRPDAPASGLGWAPVVEPVPVPVGTTYTGTLQGADGSSVEVTVTVKPKP